MDIDTLVQFFMWCTILGAGIMTISALLCMALRDVIAKMHGKLFGISENAVKVAIYGYLGVLKIGVLIFCIIPYVALVITRSQM